MPYRLTRFKAVNQTKTKLSTVTCYLFLPPTRLILKDVSIIKMEINAFEGLVCDVLLLLYGIMRNVETGFVLVYSIYRFSILVMY